MKVLLKSLKELEEEYGIEEFENVYIISKGIIYHDMIKLLGKVVEANYKKESDSYVINDWYFHPNVIKGIIIKKEYTIKRLSDGTLFSLILPPT